LQRIKEELGIAQTEKNDLKSELAESRRKGQEVNKEKEDVTKRYNEERKQLAEERDRTWRDVTATFERKIQEITIELKVIKDQRIQLTNEIGQLKLQYEAEKKLSAEKQIKLDALQQQSTDTDSKLQAEYKRMQNLQVRLTEKEQELLICKQEKEQCTEQTKALQTEIKEKGREIELLKNNIPNLQVTATNCDKLMQGLPTIVPSSSSSSSASVIEEKKTSNVQKSVNEVYQVLIGKNHGEALGSTDNEGVNALNRSASLVKPKGGWPAPFVEWINRLSPENPISETTSVGDIRNDA